MTRQKKSRKPAPLGPSQKPRQKQNAKDNDKRPKKHKGLNSGSRNNPQIEKAKGPQSNRSNDPRHGSKKPIALTPVEPVKLAEYQPQVKLKKVTIVEPELTLEQELEQIENDQRLIELLDRADAGEVLTGKDAKYFNAKTARHQQIIEALGLDQDYDDEDWEDDEEFDQQQGARLIEQWEQDDDPQEQS